jgi:hypothetical protein
MLAHRKLFILHQRNQTALSGLHIKGHDGDHEEMEQQFRRILGDPAIPARDRVRLSCALGALLSSLMTVSDLGDLSIETYGDLLREAITDLLEPRGDVSRAGPVAPTEDEARRCELGRGRNSFGAQITAGRSTGGQVSAEA